MKILQLPPDMRGLAIPNIIFYNWACHACFLWEWLHAHLETLPCVDSWSSLPSSLWCLIMSEKSHPVTSRIIKLYAANKSVARILKIFGKRKFYLSLEPLLRYKDFPSGLLPNIFYLCIIMSECDWRLVSR